MSALVLDPSVVSGRWCFKRDVLESELARLASNWFNSADDRYDYLHLSVRHSKLGSHHEICFVCRLNGISCETYQKETEARLRKSFGMLFLLARSEVGAPTYILK